MKKFALIVLLVLAAMGIIGCSSANAHTPQQSRSFEGTYEKWCPEEANQLEVGLAKICTATTVTATVELKLTDAEGQELGAQEKTITQPVRDMYCPDDWIRLESPFTNDAGKTGKGITCMNMYAYSCDRPVFINFEPATTIWGDKYNTVTHEINCLN